MATAGALFVWAGPKAWDSLRALSVKYFLFAGSPPDFGTAAGSESLRGLQRETYTTALRLLAYVMLPGFFLTLAVNAIQNRFFFSFVSLEPKLSRLDPIQGVKRIFSQRTLLEFLKSVLKMAVVGGLLWTVIDGERGTLDRVLGLGPSEMNRVTPLLGQRMTQAARQLVLNTAAFMLLLGILDLPFQFWLYMRGQKMSKEEVKREYIEQEGDPRTKGRLKEMMHRIVNEATVEGVRNASVIVRNPTHVAVAVRYAPGNDAAVPRVTAKGTDVVALQIVELARRFRVPDVADAPLARALYEIEVDEPIPEELYQAVSAIFVWLQATKGKSRK